MVEAILRCLAESRSLRAPDEERLRRAPGFDCVLIVGATCAGKTTVVDAIRRELGGEGRVDVPQRFLTRPRRERDDLLENVHVSTAEFDRLIGAGEIGMHWVRPMEGGRQERYGFRGAKVGALPVYSGNNALLSNAASLHPRDALAHALVVGVFAPEEVRERRLRARSPDLWKERPDEVRYRLSDPSSSMLAHAHVVVENHGDLERTAPSEAVALVRAVLARLGR